MPERKGDMPAIKKYVFVQDTGAKVIVHINTSGG